MKGSFKRTSQLIQLKLLNAVPHLIKMEAICQLDPPSAQRVSSIYPVNNKGLIYSIKNVIKLSLFSDSYSPLQSPIVKDSYLKW